MGNINIDIPEELHRKIKVICAMNEISIRDFLVKSLAERIGKKEVKKTQGPKTVGRKKIISFPKKNN